MTPTTGLMLTMLDGLHSRYVPCDPAELRHARVPWSHRVAVARRGYLSTLVPDSRR